MNQFRNGDYFVIRFTTGGYGNRHAKRADAVREAEGTNRYNERKYGERIVSEVVQFKNWEVFKTIPV